MATCITTIPPSPICTTGLGLNVQLHGYSIPKVDTPITPMLPLQCKFSLSVEIIEPNPWPSMAILKDLLVSTATGLPDVIIAGPCVPPAMSLLHLKCSSIPSSILRVKNSPVPMSMVCTLYCWHLTIC